MSQLAFLISAEYGSNGQKHKEYADRIAARDADRGQSLWTRLAALETDAERLKARAESDGDLRTALAAVRERTRLLDLAFRVDADRAVPLEQALRVLGGVASAVQRHVSDPATLERISHEFRRLTGDPMPAAGGLHSPPDVSGETC